MHVRNQVAHGAKKADKRPLQHPCTHLVSRCELTAHKHQALPQAYQKSSAPAFLANQNGVRWRLNHMLVNIVIIHSLINIICIRFSINIQQHLDIHSNPLRGLAFEIVNPDRTGYFNAVQQKSS